MISMRFPSWTGRKSQFSLAFPITAPQEWIQPWLQGILGKTPWKPAGIVVGARIFLKQIWEFAQNSQVLGCCWNCDLGLSFGVKHWLEVWFGLPAFAVPLKFGNFGIVCCAAFAVLLKFGNFGIVWSGGSREWGFSFFFSQTTHPVVSAVQPSSSTSSSASEDHAKQVWIPTFLCSWIHIFWFLCSFW